MFRFATCSSPKLTSLRLQGSSPALFVGTTAFEVIIKQQIKRIEEPALKCAGLVYDELMRILNQLLSKNVSCCRSPCRGTAP